jgi:hypothetical protein
MPTTAGKTARTKRRDGAHKDDARKSWNESEARKSRGIQGRPIIGSDIRKAEPKAKRNRNQSHGGRDIRVKRASFPYDKEQSGEDHRQHQLNENGKDVHVA